MLAFTAWKIWTAGVLWLLTLGSTYAPLLIRNALSGERGKQTMSFCNCLAGGVILGTMLLHVLPTLFDVPSTFGKYPLGCLFAGLSFLLLFAVDRLFLSKNHPHHHHYEVTLEDAIPQTEIEKSSTLQEPLTPCEKPLRAQAFVFVLALSLHSFLEGLGLSAITAEAELYSYTVSLVSHKWLEAFALGHTVLHAGFSPLAVFLLHLFYSVLTPFGIVFGMALVSLVPPSTSHLIATIFNGLSVGSFLFVCCVEMVPAEFLTLDRLTKYKFLTLLVGFLLMAALALLD